MQLKSAKFKTFCLTALVLSCSLLSACNPIYVTRAALVEAHILWSREDIAEILHKNEIDSTTKFKLQLVLGARENAKDLGLETAKSFASYSDIGTDELTWVVMAAPKNALQPVTWWFPIVGHVPYRGFFEEKQAVNFATELEAENLETIVRTSSAFSTLGWFNDPLLSTTLKQPTHSVINTVFHELFHSTLWKKNHVAWNESAANFFAHLATIEFFKQQLTTCQSDISCADELNNNLQKELEESEASWETELLLAGIIDLLFNELNALYNNADLSTSEILSQRAGIFTKHSNKFREHFPNARSLKKINNAEILALRTYLTGFDQFQQDWQHCNNEPRCFIKKQTEVAKTK